MNHKTINFAASRLKASLQKTFKKMKKLLRGWKKIFVNIFLLRILIWYIIRSLQTQKLENNPLQNAKGLIQTLKPKKKNDWQISTGKDAQ